MSTHNELTVNELRALLDQISAAGHGNDKIAIPYNPGGGTIGSKPAVSITGSSNGFDWDHGKVFLHTSKELGLPSADVLERVQKAERHLGRVHILVGRLGSERAGPLDEQIAQFKAALDAMQTPPAPKKLSR